MVIKIWYIPILVITLISLYGYGYSESLFNMSLRWQTNLETIKGLDIRSNTISSILSDIYNNKSDIQVLDSLITSEISVGKKIDNISNKASKNAIKNLVTENYTGIPTQTPQENIETAILWGLTDFIVDRAKQEIILTLIMELQNNPIFTNYMPNTYKILPIADSMNFKYMLNTLQQSAIKDFNELPDNIYKYNSSNSNFNKILYSLKLFWDISLSLQKGSSPSNVLNAIDWSELYKVFPSDKLKKLISMIDSFSDNNKISISLDDYQSLNDTGEQIFLCILHNNDTNLFSYSLDEIKTDHDKLMEPLSDLLDFFGTIEDQYNDIQELITDTNKKIEMKNDITEYINNDIDIIRLLISTFSNQNDSQVIECLTLLDDSKNIYNDICNHDYSSIVLQSYQILLEIDPKINNSDKMKEFVRYSSMIASMASASNSNQVQEILDNTALPAGSFRQKFQTPWSITLNAYLGLNFGYEQTIDPSINYGGFVFGITAPVGIEFDWKWFGIYIPIIDVGALASARIYGGTNISTSSVIGFQQVLSPGLFVRFGFNDLPLAIGIGGQYCPQLREYLYNSDSSKQNIDVWRVVAFVAIDIPILNF